MTSAGLRGVIAAIATPFAADGEPDLERFVRLARHLLANGCDALNVCGTTGEATSMSVFQRKAVMRTAAENLPRDRLMLGTGAASVADAADLTAFAGDLGVAGALLLPPFYYKGVPDDGIVAYVERVAAAAPAALPLYLYNYPALSGVPYHLDLVVRLHQKFGDRLAGIKDSSGDLPYARSVAAALPGFDVFPSNEATLMEARGGGFAGCISATANVTCTLCAAAWVDGNEDALKKASAIRARISQDALVPAVKATVAAVMDDEAYARTLPPFVALGSDRTRALIADLRTLGAL